MIKTNFFYKCIKNSTFNTQRNIFCIFSRNLANNF